VVSAWKAAREQEEENRRGKTETNKKPRKIGAFKG
jgi:hypothetical protein